MFNKISKLQIKCKLWWINKLHRKILVVVFFPYQY